MVFPLTTEQHDHTYNNEVNYLGNVASIYLTSLKQRIKAVLIPMFVPFSSNHDGCVVQTLSQTSLRGAVFFLSPSFDYFLTLGEQLGFNHKGQLALKA